MSVLCCITCVCITECALYTAPLIQKVFPYKSPLHTIYSKILQKTSEVFFSFMVFFFSSFFLFFSLSPEYGDQCCCSGFRYNRHVNE